MAADPWKRWDVEIPADGQRVWVRILNYYGPPFLAYYTDADQTLSSVTTRVIVPLYYVARWKPE